MQRIVPMDVKNRQLDLNSFREIRYKTHKILYNSSGIIYDYMFFPFDVHSLIIVNKVLYMQTTAKNIYLCGSLLNFSFLSAGEIVGKFRDALVYAKDATFYFFYKNIQVAFGFFLSNNAITLTYDHNQMEPVVRSYICYKKYFVVFGDCSMYLFDQSLRSDLKFVFSGSIQSYSIRKMYGINFLLVDYKVDEVNKNCLFYLNQIIAHDVSIHSDGKTDSLIFNIPSFRPSAGVSDEPMVVQHNDNISEILKSIAKKKNTNNLLKKSRRDLKNYKFFDDLQRSNQISSTSKTIYVDDGKNMFNNYSNNHQNINFNHRSINQCTFYLDDLEKTAFDFNNIKNKKTFLKNYFLGIKKDIFSPVFIELAQKAVSVERLIDLVAHRVSSNSVNILKNLKYDEWFYQRINSLEDLSSCRKTIKSIIKYSNRHDFSNHEIINRKYTRVFTYSPKHKNNENLAYRIIKLENQFFSRLNLDKLMLDLRSSPEKFIKQIQKFHGNTAITEMVSMFLENTIVLHADVTDLNNYRHNTFLQRTLFNIGLLLINPDFLSHKNKEQAVIKINSTNYCEKLSAENLFFYLACSSPYFSADESKSASIPSIANKYANSLFGEINDEEIKEFISEIPSKKQHLARFLIFCLSNFKKTDKNEKSVFFNKLLRVSLNDVNLENRLTSIISLAKFNYGTNDQSIIHILQKEMSRCGPTDCDKTNLFFDSHYRNISAISLALIASKPFFANTNFSFINLLILGLTSIGQKTDISFFRRSDDCLVEEIFYSELFTLLTNFYYDPLFIVNEVVNDDFTSEIMLYKAAAKLFYAGLYVVHHPDYSSDALVDSILKFAEKIEDQAYVDRSVLILFNYALVAVSIIKSGTCDVSILKVLRRQFLNTKNIKKMHNISFFDKSKKVVENIKGIDQESIQFYKICIGLVCATFGLSKLKQTSVKQLVVTFFMSRQISYDFSCYDILRSFIVKSLEPFEANLHRFKIQLVKNKAKKGMKKVMAMFQNEFFNLSEIDKKYVVDVLSDFYENHNRNQHMGSIFDMKTLALLLLNCK